jgi:tetratricopeptide (TPR) repeat protein
LPWLRLSADLDPQRIETYTVAAYWLRGHLGKVDEAEQFLREGLRANPTSYEILFELGMLYSENHHDTNRARNLWELALRRWQDQDAVNKPSVLQLWEEKKDVSDVQPDINIYLKIITELALLEEGQGELRQALHYRELEVKVSPLPDKVQEEIDKLQQKLASPPTSASAK